MKNLPRRILDNHQLLTALSCINLAGVFAASVMDLGDRTFFLFLAGFVGFGWLALRAADHAIDTHVQQRVNPADFAMDLIPNNHEPTAYDLTVGTNEPIRGLTPDENEARLVELGVPPYIAVAEAGEYVGNDGIEITWTPSTTDTTGETR